MADYASGVDGMNGGWWFIFLLFFLLAWGNGGFFGGNNGTGNQINNDFLYTNLANQVRNLEQETNAGFNNATAQNFAIQKDILQQTNDIQAGLCQGFNGVNTNVMTTGNGIQSSLANLGYQMQQCCCNLSQKVVEDGDKTRALINDQIIQSLRDKLADRDRELTAAQLTIQNTTQTSAILNSLGNYYPAPSYAPCPCGCGA